MDIRRAAAAAVAAGLLGAAILPASAGAAEPAVPEQRAIAIAEEDENAREARAGHPGLRPSASRADHDGDWEVGFFAGDEQLVLVIVDDQTGAVEESWTGDQVAWKMARGYDGAFGRSLNAPWIWLPLCAIFFFGLFDWRRPLRMAHLDLLVIVAGFGVSHFYFNRGEIGLSVPLAYPALVYLLGRALWLAFRPRAPGLRPLLPLTALAVATLFLIGVRVGLNVADSNVVDVGYSGVIGADKITDYEPIYGDFPEGNTHGDTYGPLAYYAYVPFEFILPWSGNWDELPAAHAAAIFFDLATIGALFLLGRRLRAGPAGTYLGTALAFAWTANPYTALALESNTNDSLVALLLVATLLFLNSATARGAMLALATATKFAPIALFPLFATYAPAKDRNTALTNAGSADDARSDRSSASARRAGGTAGGPTPQPPGEDVGGTAVTGPARRALPVVVPYAAAFVAVTALVMAQTILDPGFPTFWDRTIGNQAGRTSPFSVWGQADLEWLHTAVKAGAALLALAVAIVPRRRDAVTVAALGTAVLIAFQLTLEHWFYLYIPWFLPFLLVALLTRGEAGATDRRGSPRREPSPA
ncbi:MAG: PepSY domain-containing protein [Solirubrobacterales bacterium]